MTNVVNIALPDSEAMADRVAEEAAKQLLTEWGTDPDGDEYTVRSQLAQRIEAAVVDTIKAQASELVPQIAKDVLDRGVQPTDSYGFTTSREPKSVGQVIAETVIADLSVSRGTSFGRNRSLLEEMIHKEVEQALRTELKEAMDNAKRIVAEAVTESATKALREAVIRGLPEVRF